MFSIRYVTLGVVLSVFLHSAVWAQSEGGQSRVDEATPTATAEGNSNGGSRSLANPFHTPNSRDDDFKFELQPGTDPENHLGFSLEASGTRSTEFLDGA